MAQVTWSNDIRQPVTPNPRGADADDSIDRNVFLNEKLEAFLAPDAEDIYFEFMEQTNNGLAALALDIAAQTLPDENLDLHKPNHPRISANALLNAIDLLGRHRLFFAALEGKLDEFVRTEPLSDSLRKLFGEE